MAAIILFSLSVLVIYMLLWYVLALLQQRNDIADVAWGLGFVVLSWSLFFQFGVADAKTYLLLGMVTAWGVRLATHIAIRHRGKPEDRRYQAMRQSWKYPVLQSLTHVFLSQGFFLLLVATPILIFFVQFKIFFAQPNNTLLWFNYLGFGIWLMGLVWETVADYQLAQFLRDPINKGKIMRYGVWKYTRHPNYFGEVSLWWGFYLFTLFPPFWYLGIIGPITITFLILGVSGIPMLERRYQGNAEYELYQKTTSAFFPWFVKSLDQK